MLDIFNDDAFGVVELTAAINALPFQPSRIGSMGLFSKKPISKLTAVVEMKEGKLSLVPTAARGTQPTGVSSAKRNVRSFAVPHFPQHQPVLADDVQDVRAFGQDDRTETVNEIVNDTLEAMKQNHEKTWEYYRANAIQGIARDADGTILYNFFDEFNIVQNEINFDFAVDAQDPKLFCMDVTRAMETALGGETYGNIHCFCGDQWFDSFITHAGVKEAYDRFQDSAFFRETQRGPNGVGGGFTFCGITFENYRGSAGGAPFIPADIARFVPTGAGKDTFMEVNAPADYIETVNTRGLPLYAKQERMKFDKGIEIETQSNTLMIPTRPATLIKSTGTGGVITVTAAATKQTIPPKPAATKSVASK